MRTFLIVALFLLSACSQTSSAAQPAATSAPPTSTPRPTATPAPEEITYYAPSGESPRTLWIRYPQTGDPPYPWVLITPCMECLNSNYSTFADALLARGYAVVQLNNAGLGEDLFCAWAWLEDNSRDRDLDIDRAIAFSHGVGIATTTLGLADETLWTEWLQGCPSPAPSPVHVAGVATYSAWFLIPDGTLVTAPVASEMGVSSRAVQDTAAVLQELPPAEWPTSDLLTDDMRAIARYLPLYYVSGPKPADQMPAFLITHGEIDSIVPISESEAMAAALADAGLSVETLWIPNASFMDVISRIGDVPEQLAAAIDTFAQGLFSDD